MAAYNDDGLLRYHACLAVNGSDVIQSSGHNLPVATEALKDIQNSTMPPRTGMESLSFTATSKSSRCPISPDKSFSLEHPVVEHSDCTNSKEGFLDPSQLHPTLSINPGCDSFGTSPRKNFSYQDLATRRSECKRRLESCAKRLKDVRSNASSILARIVSSNLPTSALPYSCIIPTSISRIAFDEETESSTDDEQDTLVAPLDCSQCCEDHWLATRAVVFSHWYWLLSEMRKSQKSLDNLRIIKNSYRKWKSEFPIQPQNASESCSRTLPFNVVPSGRQIHDLGSSKCSQLISKIRSHSVDRSMRCSCITSFSGPCILCCSAASSVTNIPPDIPQHADLLTCAQPLAGHIHQKLSLPGDIQLPLRLESRLAASPNILFREHKTTTRSLSPSEKPAFLRTPQSVLPMDGITELPPLPDAHAARSQPKCRRTFQRYLVSPGGSRRSRNGFNFHRLSNKHPNGPSALRRILDLSPDHDQTNTTNKTWHQPMKKEDQ